ncbi:hypothetical protein P9847_11260 [Paenibacillus chibensis]|uniref:Uncharacterized protein n=1 Tax=Paenibacillus chibensis TaxID=59846 RepID=A0ABU6PSL6_9BACL|nr:hypothetical protein [Paenibacillus chibensis]
MAGLGIFCGAVLLLFLVFVISGGYAEILFIVGVSIVIAMLGLVLVNQHHELEARRRAEKRRLLNLNQNMQSEQKSASPP